MIRTLVRRAARAPVLSQQYFRSAYVPQARCTPYRQAGSTYRQFVRSYTLCMDEPARIVKYDDIKKLSQKLPEDTVIVDVREPDEFAAGHIPGAINVPYKSAPGALGLEPEDFKESFGFEKPSADKQLVFYCLGGVRSAAAESLAATFGYKNRLNYAGSYEDWVEQESRKEQAK